MVAKSDPSNPMSLNDRLERAPNRYAAGPVAKMSGLSETTMLIVTRELPSGRPQTGSWYLSGAAP
jgi:hypothetical protein